MIEVNDTVYLKKRIGVLPADARGKVVAIPESRDVFAVGFVDRHGKPVAVINVMSTEVELAEKHDEAGA